MNLKINGLFNVIPILKLLDATFPNKKVLKKITNLQKTIKMNCLFS